MNGVELTTMCALIQNNMVLMINRKKNWKGWSFPGGHLEKDESIHDCISREIFEETGLSCRNLKYKGFTHFYNTETEERHIISNYICTDFSGDLISNCDEGNLQWIDIDTITDYPLAEGMEYRLPLFFNNGIKELYVEWNKKNGYTKVMYIDM